MVAKTAPKPAANAAPAPTPKVVVDNASDSAESAKKQAKPKAKATPYGYSPSAVIRVNKEKEAKFKGARADWYKLICQFDGQTVNDFEAKVEELKIDDAPRGWVRFFCQNEFITLETPKA